MFLDKKFRRDCTNNTASENKIDQILEEFEINKKYQAPSLDIEQIQREEEAKRAAALAENAGKVPVQPHEALEKIMRAIKQENKVPKCLEMLKTLFKDHVEKLHPAHILQTIHQLTDVTLNFRKQDDRKYLLVIINIIIEKRAHCIRKEYGHFYKAIDILRVNLLLFNDDSFHFQSNLKKLTDYLDNFIQEQEYLRSVDYKLPEEIQPAPVVAKTDEPEINKQEEQVASQEVEQKQPEAKEDQKVSAIRERLMKKKLEKQQVKEEEKAAKAEQVNSSAAVATNQIQLITKQEAQKIQQQQEQEQKIAQLYEFNLPADLQNLLTDKVQQHYLKRKLLFKALMSMKFMLSRDWSKISVYNLIYDIFLNKRNVFTDEEQTKIDEFMTELQNVKTADSKKLTQSVMQERKIIQNATNSINDVRKMTMGATQSAGDGQASWVARQLGL